MAKNKNKNRKKQKTSTKLEESIHILNVLMNNIQTELACLQSLASVPFNGDQLYQINQLTFKHGLIQVQSYMDELEKHFFKNLEKPHLDTINPYYKRVKKELEQYFPHIRRYRNNVLAHGYRTNRNSNIFVHGSFRTYSIPQNLKEYMFVVECLYALNNLINQLFPNAHSNVIEVIKKKTEQDSTPFKTRLTDEQLSTSLRQLQNDLDKISIQKPS